jgi:septal ring factor EnvC (AmiA/AmiB activator)
VVRYAGPIRGLDAGLVIDHGDYYTVIGKLGDLGVPVGAPVTRGDRIGRAARHRVYFEVRVKLGAGGRPIDPEPLLERAAKKR